MAAMSSVLSATPSCNTTNNNKDRLLPVVLSGKSFTLPMPSKSTSHFLPRHTHGVHPRKCIMAASNDSAQPAATAPEPSDLFSAFSGRKGWIAGIAITFLVPLLTGKLGPLQLFKDKFDSDLQKVEDVVEAMEKTAAGLDKAAEDLAEKFPEGSPLRNVAKIVEHAAEEVARDAHLADAAIDKVDHLIHHPFNTAEFQEIEEQAVVYLNTQSKEADNKNEEAKANIEQA